MKKKMLTTPVLIDPGSEAVVGFDYQIHVATGICIDMLADKEVQYILCEFHEDVVQVRQDSKLEMVQIKKRGRGKWSLNDVVKPEKGQSAGMLAKLFKCVQNGKDVSKIRLCGHGETTGGDGCSLAGLIALLSVPLTARDADWKAEFQVYSDYLANELKPQGIEPNTVEKAMSLLEINFGLGHPDAIRDKNCATLEKAVRTIWNVELTRAEINELYDELYKHVHELSLKPQKTWSEKAISRDAALTIVNDCIKRYEPSASRLEIRTMQEKLTRVGLAQKVSYALQQRLTSMYLRYEIGIDSVVWEDMRTELVIKWEKRQREDGISQGPIMWESMRYIFKELGQTWSLQDQRLGVEFAEGVFFDMTGTCDVDWRLATNG